MSMEIYSLFFILLFWLNIFHHCHCVDPLCQDDGFLAVGCGLCSENLGSIDFKSVKRTADLLTQLINDEISSVYGPILQVGIVSHATKNIHNYATMSSGLLVAYAQNNRYNIKIFTEESFNNGQPISDVRWAKIKILEEALHPTTGWGKHMDYIVWVDADLVFLDLNFRIEQMFSEHRRANLIASAEHAGSSTLINSGCLLVRNSKWSRNFLRDWWEYADRSLFSDQEQFDLLYESRKSSALPNETAFTDNIVILPPDALNSDPPAMTQQKHHNPVLHLMGEEADYRIIVFKAGLSEVCRAASTRIDGEDLLVSHQLTLTQPNLLQWALDSYSIESSSLMQQYEELVSPPPKLTSALSHWEVYPQGLAPSRTLANSVHHYAHALVHSLPLPTPSSSKSTSESAPGKYNYVRAVTLRKKVYQLLRRNLVAWKAETGPTAEIDFDKIRTDWPELLKITSIAGQHLLSVTADDVVSQREKRLVAGEILSMMQEMLQNSHPAQHDAILLMVADIHQQIGVLDLAQSYLASDSETSADAETEPYKRVSASIEGNGSGDTIALEFIDAALQHFQLALDVTRSVAEKSGRHLLISPLTLTANALASSGQFAQAFEYYEQAVNINSNLFGAEHQSNIPLLVDYAISLVHYGGECGRAAGILSKIELLLHVHDIAHGDIQYQRTADYIAKNNFKCGY